MNLNTRMNRLIDRMGDFLASYPGALPLLGLLSIIANFILQIVPGPNAGWVVASNLFLHLGLIITIIGLLLVRPIKG